MFLRHLKYFFPQLNELSKVVVCNQFFFNIKAVALVTFNYLIESVSALFKFCFGFHSITSFLLKS